MEQSSKSRKKLHTSVRVVLSITLSFVLALISVLCASIICNFTNLSLNIGELISSTMNSISGYVLVSIFTIIVFLISYKLLVKKGVTSWEALGLKHNLYVSLKHFSIGFVIGALIICATNSIWNGGESGGGLIYIGILLLTLIIALLSNKRRKTALCAK